MSRRSIALYGTPQPEQKEIPLRAGPLSALFVNGALRNIRLQDVEVIRGIYFLIRDRNWSTVVPDLHDLAIDRKPGGFRVSFVCRGVTPSDGQSLEWHGVITGSTGQGIAFAAHATPDTDFITCRTGFIVLHPLEKVVGCPVTIEHTDGRKSATEFPDRVDPVQSFFEVRAMTHEPIPGIRATCRMEGGAWETEDHRNWLDASFKTYYRPLALPWPYTVPAGEKITQSVTLGFSPAIGKLKPLSPDPVATVAVGDRTGAAMPEIGLAVTPEDLEGALRSASAVRETGAQTLAVRVSSDTVDLPGVLRRAAQLAAVIGAAAVLEIVLAGKDAPDVRARSCRCRGRRGGVSSACRRGFTGDRSQILSAVGRPAAEPAAGHGLRGGPAGLSRIAAGRRHVQLLHRAQPSAAARPSARLRPARDGQHRARGRRPLGDGNTREPAACVPLDAVVCGAGRLSRRARQYRHGISIPTVPRRRPIQTMCDPPW